MSIYNLVTFYGSYEEESSPSLLTLTTLLMGKRGVTTLHAVSFR